MKRLLALGALLALGCGSPDQPTGSAGMPSAGGGAGGGGAGGGGGIEPAPSWADLPPVAHRDPELEPFPQREAQYAKLCEKPRADQFFRTLCGGVRPNIPDLATLLKLVGLDQERAFALTGNSTSLVARSVSALNPRIIVFPRVDAALQGRDDFVMVGFVRGERFVEIASLDPSTREPNFYLLTFEQACEYQGNCDLQSVLSEEIEHAWTAYSIYSETELENTSFDCLTCHRPGGVGSKKILRMQELASPWLHWFPQRFVQRTDSDRVLGAEFADAHGADRQYGGVPVPTILNAVDEGSGAQLEAVLRAQGFAEQPNVFDPRIEAEAKTGETSPTWQAQWTLHAQGGAIPVPYPRVDVTDEAKRLLAVKSYKDVQSGAAPRGNLLDLRDVFSEDAKQKLSFVPVPGASGREIVVQMCARCHDGRSDPELGRTKFNALKLDELPREVKALAASRLSEPEGSVKRMPPWRTGQLSTAERDSAVAELLK
jgi:mono/diheme cytochrome c family protein